MHGPVRGHDPIEFIISLIIWVLLFRARKGRISCILYMVEPRLLMDRCRIVLSVSVVCDMAAGVKQSR